MLQQFYKDTLQSNFIKYLLANTYIPTIPFTANIMHVTKGNTYIHDGYFVTAKKSDAVAAIIEDLNKAKEKGSIDYLNKYDEIFIKHEPYIFGRQYLGTTTNYISNVKGYDSTTHYYLGDFLRAYRAYYNIDLMPYYNCFSNEYVDYLSLTKKDGVVKLVESNNSKYKVLSVPIKFCQKYTIAIQCNSEVTILPVFIGKKGLLKEKTTELHQLAHHGKYYPRMQFNSPIVYESPHINSVQDLIQSSLQTYDKYLRLLIQVPANLTSSIVVIEGDFKNAKNYSERLINTSKDDVLELWAEDYFTKIPYTREIDVPANSILICNNIELQKFYRDYENSPIKAIKEINKLNLLNIKIVGADLDPTIALEHIIDNPVIKIKSDYSIRDYNGPASPPDQDKDLNLYLRGLYLIKGYEVGEDESGNIITTIGINYQNNINIDVPFTSNEEKFIGVKYTYNKENQNYNLYYIPEGAQEEKDYYLIINNSKLLSDNYIIIEINEKQLVKETTLNIFKELFETYEILLLSEREVTPEKQQALTFNLDWIRVPYGTFGSNYAATETSDSSVINYYQYKDVDGSFYVSEMEIGKIEGGSNTVNLISDKSELQIPLGGSEGNWNTTYNWATLKGDDSKNYKILISTEDENSKSIRSIIAVKDDNDNIEFYNYELSFYCLSENINTDNGWLKISPNFNICPEETILEIINNTLSLNFKNNSLLDYNIISNPYYKNDSTYGYDLWELDSKIYKNTNQYVRYLNQNLYSNLNLLYINNSNTYAFTSRLIEYLSQMVICSNDPISKNIRRVQESLGVATDGLWKDSLRTEIFDRVLDKSVQLNKSVPRDMNGFLDKDSEFLLGIQNTLKQDEVWK